MLCSPEGGAYSCRFVNPSVRPLCPGRILEGTKGISMSYLPITIFYISDACPGHILESTKGIEVKLGL